MRSYYSLHIAYILSLMLLMCWGARAWFTWGMESNYNLFMIVLGATTLISWLYRIMNNVTLSFRPILLLAWMALIELRCIHSGGGLHPKDILIGILMAYPLWVMMSDEEHIEDVFSSITKVFAILLIPGIVLHLVMLVVGTLPFVIVRNPSSVLYTFYNYGVLLKSATEYEASGIRFQSIFLEPGYCGTLLAFMLHAARYDFKKRENIAMLIGLILSLSLAGILTFIAGYILNGWAQRKDMTVYFVFGIILGAIVLFGLNYNQGDNVVNEMVLNRILPSEDKDESKNRRNSIGADFYFAHLFESGEWLHGLGEERIAIINGEDFGTDEVSYGEEVIRGAGYKIYILNYGVLTVLIALMVYLFTGPGWIGWTDRYAWSFLLLIIITFLPTSYPMSFSWMLPYMMGIARAAQLKKTNELE